MKLIADSGSTKTDWRLVLNGKVIQEISTEGINPYLKSNVDIINILKNNLANKIIDSHKIRFIYFYGAGCSSIDKNIELKNIFKTIFTNSEVNIYHDLLGAAIATCGNKEGITAILGTGSNSCYFDGKKIIAEQHSLGFILGDEGSGTIIGKKLLTDFIYKKNIPDNLHKKLITDYKLTKEEILNNVYTKPYPNKYLSSFSKWVGKNIKNEEYLQNLVTNEFDDFFYKHITKYKCFNNNKINIVGSVGFYFKEYLTKVANKYNLNLYKVIQKPITGLVEYHSK